MALNSKQVTIAIKPSGNGCRSVIVAGGECLWQSRSYPQSSTDAAIEDAKQMAVLNGWRVR